MELYVSQPRGFPANFPRQLQWVAKLYRAGFLDDESAVWINTNVLSPVFWLFNGRGSAVYWFNAPTAGHVRLTQDRVRWSHSYESAQKAPWHDLSLSGLSVLEEDTRLLYVVDHTFSAPENRVSVVDGAHSKEMTGGYYEGSNGVAVVDLPNYDPSTIPPLGAARREYESGLVRYLGVRLLTSGMNARSKADVVDNPDRYCIPLGATTLNALAESITVFDEAANTISESLFGGPTEDTGSDF